VRKDCGFILIFFNIIYNTYSEINCGIKNKNKAPAQSVPFFKRMAAPAAFYFFSSYKNGFIWGRVFLYEGTVV